MVWKLPGSIEGGPDQYLAEMQVKLSVILRHVFNMEPNGLSEIESHAAGESKSKFIKLWRNHPH